MRLAPFSCLLARPPPRQKLLAHERVVMYRYPVTSVEKASGNLYSRYDKGAVYL